MKVVYLIIAVAVVAFIVLSILVVKKMRKKNVTSIALIHDLNNLRLGEVGGVRYKRSLYEDKNIVKEYDFVISHNNKMLNQRFSSMLFISSISLFVPESDEISLFILFILLITVA